MNAFLAPRARPGAPPAQGLTSECRCFDRPAGRAPGAAAAHARPRRGSPCARQGPPRRAPRGAARPTGWFGSARPCSAESGPASGCFGGRGCRRRRAGARGRPIAPSSPRDGRAPALTGRPRPPLPPPPGVWLLKCTRGRAPAKRPPIISVVLLLIASWYQGPLGNANTLSRRMESLFGGCFRMDCGGFSYRAPQRSEAAGRGRGSRGRAGAQARGWVGDCRGRSSRDREKTGSARAPKLAAYGCGGRIRRRGRSQGAMRGCAADTGCHHGGAVATPKRRRPSRAARIHRVRRAAKKQCADERHDEMNA